MRKTLKTVSLHNGISFLRSVLKGTKDILYPKVCVVCRHSLHSAGSDEHVCADCLKKIKKHAPPFCIRCGRQLKRQSIAKNICPQCIRRQFHFDRTFSSCQYEGTIKELIHAFKYKQKEHLSATLSKLMIEFIREYHVPMEIIDYIVPMPLSSAKLREREFNQAKTLSTHIAFAFNKRLLDTSLLRHRHTKTQADLAWQERLENVKDSFSVSQPETIAGKNILLIDDVLTTGATASEATKALKKAGAGVVFVLTLAS
jgi:competence protein ComFC